MLSKKYKLEEINNTYKEKMKHTKFNEKFYRRFGGENYRSSTTREAMKFERTKVSYIRDHACNLKPAVLNAWALNRLFNRRHVFIILAIIFLCHCISLPIVICNNKLVQYYRKPLNLEQGNEVQKNNLTLQNEEPHVGTQLSANVNLVNQTLSQNPIHKEALEAETKIPVGRRNSFTLITGQQFQTNPQQFSSRTQTHQNQASSNSPAQLNGINSPPILYSSANNLINPDSDRNAGLSLPNEASKILDSDFSVESSKSSKKSRWVNHNLKSHQLKHESNKNVFGSTNSRIANLKGTSGKSKLDRLLNFFQQVDSFKKGPSGGTSSNKASAFSNRNQHMLPNGPPPYRPSMLLLDLHAKGALDKVKRSELFKKVYKSKVYYLYLDVLQQLALVVSRLAQKKFNLGQAKLGAVQVVINKLTSKGGQLMKLKWPLIMMNPYFLRELISTPTFLIMLFHAIEVAYMSMPHKSLLLKPLVKLVEQPGPDKEEKIWWGRKRIYDTLNGFDASELQPNLKTVHFRNPGKPTPIAIPTLVALVRKVAKLPTPNPSSFQQFPSGSPTLQHHSQLYLPGEAQSYSDTEDSNSLFENQAPIRWGVGSQSLVPTSTLVENETQDWNQIKSAASLMQEAGFDRPYQMEETKLRAPHSTAMDYFTASSTIPNQEDWLSHMPSAEQLMSQSEFNSLDPKDRELVLREARDRFEESKWTNELIKQHSDFIESFTNPMMQAPSGSLITGKLPVPQYTDDRAQIHLDSATSESYTHPFLEPLVERHNNRKHHADPIQDMERRNRH